LENQDSRVKAMLFAQQGMVKLRLAFRSMAAKHKHTMDFAEVTYRGADEMRKMFGVVREPAIIFVKEKGSRPLKFSGKMTQVRLASLFEQHQHHWATRLSEHNFKGLCGAGSLGTQVIQRETNPSLRVEITLTVQRGAPRWPRPTVALSPTRLQCKGMDFECVPFLC